MPMKIAPGERIRYHHIDGLVGKRRVVHGKAVEYIFDSFLVANETSLRILVNILKLVSDNQTVQQEPHDILGDFFFLCCVVHLSNSFSDSKRII